MRTGQALAAAAVVVALPRHIVAGLHAAGLPVVHDATWTALVVTAAVALAVLEALTMGYAIRARLPRYVWAMLAAISLTFAPSVVADSAGLSLVELTGAATLAHFAWSAAIVASTLLIVLTAGAGDAALDRERQAVAEAAARVAEADSRAAAAQQAMTDHVDSLRQTLTAQMVTVNVGQTTPPDATGSDSRPVEGETRLLTPAAREVAVFSAMQGGASTLLQIAAASGLTVAQVRRTTHWQERSR